MTQEDVADHLGLSRPTVAQMELGNRAVTSLELDRLAYYFGRDLGSFLADDFRGDDALVALFRRHSEGESDHDVLDTLRDCLALGRELAGLERRLGIDRDLAGLVTYALPMPKGKWEAIQQGERVAGEERRRLGLGAAPALDLTEIYESQGIRTAQRDLPDDISGVTIVEPEIGVLLVVNRKHHILRRRYSLAHEYCHAVLDREQRGVVSRSECRDDLLEIRANAFAACFLMPRDGVQSYVERLAKGRPGRLQAEIYDERSSVRVEGRSTPGSQVIQLYDVVQLAHHFGVSCASTLFRLKNLKLISSAELAELREQDQCGASAEVTRFLDLEAADHAFARDRFRRRFLGLGLEARRRDLITTSKLCELVAMIEVSREELLRILEELGIDAADEPADALLPEG